MSSSVARRTDRARLYFGDPTALVLVAMVMLGTLFALLVLLARHRHDWLQTLDHHVANSLHLFGTDHPAFVTAMRGVSAVGSPAAWWVLIVPLAVVLMRRGRRRAAAYAVVTLGGSWVLNRMVKTAVNRARPHLAGAFATAHGASFPSAHAQAATVACGVLLVLGWPHLSAGRHVAGVVAAVLTVFAVSLSRVALGVHYVSDVSAAIVLGVAWVLLMTAALNAWQHSEEPATRTR